MKLKFHNRSETVIAFPEIDRSTGQIDGCVAGETKHDDVTFR